MRELKNIAEERLAERAVPFDHLSRVLVANRARVRARQQSSREREPRPIVLRRKIVKAQAFRAVEPSYAKLFRKTSSPSPFYERAAADTVGIFAADPPSGSTRIVVSEPDSLSPPEGETSIIWQFGTVMVKMLVSCGSS